MFLAQNEIDRIDLSYLYNVNLSVNDKMILQRYFTGKPVKRATDAFKLAHLEIEWRSINGFRNISVHDYFGSMNCSCRLFDNSNRMT